MLQRTSTRSLLILGLLSVTLAPAAVVRAEDGADQQLPPNATLLPNGGTAYTFQARPDEPAPPPPGPGAPGYVLSTFGLPAAATIGAEDDRENTEPTSWYVFQHQTATDVVNTATASNLRVVDLSVETTSPSPLFSAVFVANTQTYAKTWWFLANVTPADLLTFITTNNARIVSMKTTDDPAASVRFFVIMISNTGADAKTWYFYQGQTTAQLTTLWQNNNARLVQVTSHVKNATTLYDAVMISNTGADARSWFWYVNETVPEISAHITTNNARLVDLDRDPSTGNYNVIMNSCPGGCPAWWWYVNVPTSSLISTATGVGGRLIDVNTTPGCGDQCWSILLIDNSHVTISGNAGIAGATITYTGGSTTADGAGNYAFTVSSGWNGTVTPTKTGYRFTPANRAYAGQSASVTGQNFAATPVRGDFNGDGKADIVWRNTTNGSNAIWYMNGLTVTGGGAFNSAPTAWSIVGVGDFNGDGKPDIVWRNTTNGTNAIWYMDGLNVTGGASFNSAPTVWSIVGVGDFNGDGKPDIVWRNTANGTNAIWFMDGSTVTSGGSFYSAPTDWAIVGTGDFNGDGKPDIVWRNTANGTNAIWFMDGLTVTSGGSFNSAPAVWSIEGVGDFNGDGKPDIVWRNTANGTNAIWFMDGLTVMSGGSFNSAPTAWSIVGPK